MQWIEEFTNMVDTNELFIITLHVNGLDAQIKRTEIIREV